jgi:hypothetical protein
VREEREGEKGRERGVERESERGEKEKVEKVRKVQCPG